MENEKILEQSSENVQASIEKDMIYCYKCGTKYSKRLKKCPSCKTKKPNRFYNKWWFWLFVVFLIIMISSNSKNSETSQSGTNGARQEQQETEEEYKAKCGSVAYKDIARDPNNYVGQYAVFKGKVIQMQESGSRVMLRVDVTQNKSGFWEDTVYVDYKRKDENESRILEDDIITMYGEIKGIKKYTAVLGNAISIPHLEAKYIELNQ